MPRKRYSVGRSRKSPRYVKPWRESKSSLLAVSVARPVSTVIPSPPSPRVHVRDGPATPKTWRRKREAVVLSTQRQRLPATRRICCLNMSLNLFRAWCWRLQVAVKGAHLVTKGRPLHRLVRRHPIQRPSFVRYPPSTGHDDRICSASAIDSRSACVMTWSGTHSG